MILLSLGRSFQRVMVADLSGRIEAGDNHSVSSSFPAIFSEKDNGPVILQEIHQIFFLYIDKAFIFESKFDCAVRATTSEKRKIWISLDLVLFFFDEPGCFVPVFGFGRC